MDQRLERKWEEARMSFFIIHVRDISLVPRGRVTILNLDLVTLLCTNSSGTASLVELFGALIEFPLVLICFNSTHLLSRKLIKYSQSCLKFKEYYFSPIFILNILGLIPVKGGLSVTEGDHVIGLDHR